MTYEQSEKHRDKYSDKILLQKIIHNGIEHTIKNFLIAPKTYDDKEKLFDLTFRKGRDNGIVLRELGLINEDLDVYLVASPRNSDELHIYNLQHYLSESDQLS